MNLTSQQRNVLLTLTTEWQTPIQVANELPKASGDISNVQQVLKDLIHIGLVQINPVVVGLYRLTTDGIRIKALELSENNVIASDTKED